MSGGAGPAEARNAARRRGAAFLAAGAATAIWGANYAIVKRVLAEVDPLAVAGTRVLAAGAVFGGWILLRDGAPGLAPGRLLRGALPGLLGIFANQILFVEGLKRTTAAHSAIAIALTPIFVLILSSLAREERITLAKSTGIAVAFAGVGIIALEHTGAPGSATLRGDLLTLMAVVAFSGFIVAGKPLLRDFGPLRATSLAFVTGGPVVFLVALPAMLRQPWAALSGPAIAGLLYAVLGSTLAAYILYYAALARLEPSRLAVFTYLQPVMAALVAFGFAGESVTPRFVAGGIMVLAGVLLAERG